MKTKSDPLRFTLRFCAANPRHQKTMEALEVAGRRKAYLVADAVYEYLMRHGVGGVGEVVVNDEVSGIGEVVEVETADKVIKARNELDGLGNEHDAVDKSTGASPLDASPHNQPSHAATSNAATATNTTSTPTDTNSSSSLNSPETPNTMPFNEDIRNTILSGLKMFGGG